MKKLGFVFFLLFYFLVMISCEKKRSEDPAKNSRTENSIGSQIEVKDMNLKQLMSLTVLEEDTINEQVVVIH